MSELELTGSKGNFEFLKSKFLKQVAAGEKILSAHYEVEFPQYPDMNIHIEATQIPSMRREPVEGRTAMGLMLHQQGNPINAGEITITAAETLEGKVLEFIRESVKEKRYMDIIIRITPESLGGDHAAEVKLSHCWIGSDVIDLANESVTEFIRPPMLVSYNWVE